MNQARVTALSVTLAFAESVGAESSARGGCWLLIRPADTVCY